MTFKKEENTLALNHFPHVYQPVQVGSMTLKNRIQFSPMVSNHADFITGQCTEEQIAFLRMQAKTGCGLITIGSTPVNFEEARDFYGCLSVVTENDFPGLCLLSGVVHDENCKLSIELSHAGQWAYPRGLQEKGLKALVPSLIPEFHDPERFEEVTKEKMASIVNDFVTVADRCARGGLDMVMIHLAHNNLISSFLSPAFNHRTDEYGGTPENRWRFPTEIIKAVYEKLNGRAMIEIRISGNEAIPGGTTIEERIEFLKSVEEYVDLIHVSGGTLRFNQYEMCHTMPSYYMPSGLNVEYAAKIKAAITKSKVSVVGGITSLAQAEEIIASGKADIVAMAKALFADNKMVIKGERGQEDDIIPCMRCMYCARNIFDETHLIGCATNPTIGWETLYPRLYAPLKKKKVMIIGGGPGGMFASHVLTDRGHDVVLYEKEEKLGGRFPELSALPIKEGHRAYFDYMVKHTEKCGAKIVLGTEVTPDVIREEAPDAVIVAVGAELIKPPIPGIDKPNVHSIVAIDRKEEEVGDEVVICGGGLSGLECALGLAEEGKKVSVIDMLPMDELTNNILFFIRVPLLRKLEEYGVKLIGNTKIKEFTDEGVVCTDADGAEVLFKADDVVLALGLKPNKELVESLSQVIPESYVIGDADKAGMLGDATTQAYRICYDL